MKGVSDAFNEPTLRETATLENKDIQWVTPKESDLQSGMASP